MFMRCDGGDMLVINASKHTGNPEGHSDYWVTSRRHRKMLSSERHLSDYPHLNRFLHHWPTVLWYSSLTDLCPGRYFQNEWERCTLSFKSAYRTYNVLCIWCFEEKLYHSNKYVHKYGVFMCIINNTFFFFYPQSSFNLQLVVTTLTLNFKLLNVNLRENWNILVE